MNPTESTLPASQQTMASGVSIGWAMGQLANRSVEHQHQHQQINFSSLLKALLGLRDRQLITDGQFSELIETACTVLIEKRVSFAVEKVIEHQINVSLLTKMLGK